MLNVKKVLASIFVSMTLFSGQANAQMATLDFANLIQSIFSVITEFSQEANQAVQMATQAESYYQQVQQYAVEYQTMQAQYQMLKNINAESLTGMLATVAADSARKRTYENKVTGLYGTLGNVGEFMTQKYNEIAASGLSESDWLTREAKINQQRQDGNGFLSNYEQGLIQSVGNRYDELVKLQGSIYASEGTHSDLQLLNTHMNSLLGTLNQTLEYNTFIAQRATARDIEQDAFKQGQVNIRQNIARPDHAKAQDTANSSIEAMKNYNGN